MIDQRPTDRLIEIGIDRSAYRVRSGRSSGSGHHWRSRETLAIAERLPHEPFLRQKAGMGEADTKSDFMTGLATGVPIALLLWTMIISAVVLLAG